MNTLQQLNLTEKDFKLIIDGLDVLPERYAVGKLFKHIMVGMISKDEAQYEKMEKEMMLEEDRKEKDKELLKEDIKILQGKLLMLKRYLIENSALNETTDILNRFS